MKTNQPIKRVLRLVVGIVFAGFFGFLAFRNMDWGHAWETVRGASPVWIGVGVVCLGVDYSLRVVRWWVMLRPVSPELRLSTCFGPFLASIAMNNVLPFRAGDITRAFGFQKQLGVGPAKTIGTMLVERLLDLVTLLGFLAWGISVAGGKGIDPRYIVTAQVLAVVGVLMLVGCLVFPRGLMVWAQRNRGSAMETGRAKVEKAWELAEDLFVTLNAMRSWGTIVSILGLSVTAWFLEGALFACGLMALDSSAPIASGWFALATGTLATLIPSTPGYVGTFDFMTKVAYGAFGVSETLAGTTALLAHVMIWVPLTLVGGGWLLFTASRTQTDALDSSPR